MSRLRKALISGDSIPAADIVALSTIDRLEKDFGQPLTRDQASQVFQRVNTRLAEDPASDEEVRDLIESTMRDPIIGSVAKSLIGTGKQAVELGKGLGRLAVGGFKLGKEAIVNEITQKGIKSALAERDKLGEGASDEERRKAFVRGYNEANPQAQKFLAVMKNAKPIAKEIGKDMLRNVGVDVDRGSLSPDLDVFIDKMEEGLLSPALDAMIVAGAAGKIAKLPKVARQVAKAKEGLKKASGPVSKAQRRAASEAEITRGIVPPTQAEELQALAGNWRKLDIKKQLDNPNFVEGVGKRLTTNLNRVSRRQRAKLDRAVAEVSKKPVDVTAIRSEALQGLQDGGFITAGRIDPVLTRGVARQFWKKLEKAEDMTAGELNTLRTQLGDKINWTKQKPVDQASEIIWKSLRNELGNKVPGFNPAAADAHTKLKDIGTKFKNIEKASDKGAKFARQGFATNEEYRRLIELAKKLDDGAGVPLIENANTIRSWQLWNQVFSQNLDLLPSSMGVRGFRGGTRPLIEAARKRAAHAGAQPLTRAAAGVAQAPLTAPRSRVLLESEELRRRGQ